MLFCSVDIVIGIFCVFFICLCVVIWIIFNWLFFVVGVLFVVRVENEVFVMVENNVVLISVVNVDFFIVFMLGFNFFYVFLFNGDDVVLIYLMGLVNFLCFVISCVDFLIESVKWGKEVEWMLMIIIFYDIFIVLKIINI